MAHSFGGISPWLVGTSLWAGVVEGAAHSSQEAKRKRKKKGKKKEKMGPEF